MSGDTGTGAQKRKMRTVAVADRDIKAVTRLLIELVGEQPAFATRPSAPPRNHVNRAELHGSDRLVNCARHISLSRSRRTRDFNGLMFGEAAWDMLLALYICDRSGQRYTVSGLADQSGAPHTTALRWLDFLETKEGLVVRSPSPTDRRIHFVELTDKARRALDAYFSAVIDDWHLKDGDFNQNS